MAILPKTVEQRAAILRLRTETELCSAASVDPPPVTFWGAKRTRLRKLIAFSDPRAFLTWSALAETMFPEPYARFALIELRDLRKSGNWAVWRRAIRERAIGLPFPCFYDPLTSSNAIHHGYHLHRLQAETGVQVSDFGLILELGGGYGSLCRIAHGRRFAGRYVLYDLPELCALQRYYLDSLGISGVETVSNVAELRAKLEQPRCGPRLFVATWSLSESPLDFRAWIEEVIDGFDAFLIAYQKEFLEIDNEAFFAGWQRRFSGVQWTVSNIDHLPGNAYLFGRRR